MPHGYPSAPVSEGEQVAVGARDSDRKGVHRACDRPGRCLVPGIPHAYPSVCAAGDYPSVRQHRHRAHPAVVTADFGQRGFPGGQVSR